MASFMSCHWLIDDADAVCTVKSASRLPKIDADELD